MVSVNVTGSPVNVSVGVGGTISVSAATASNTVAIGSGYQPAPHASTHLPGGSDAIEYADRATWMFDIANELNVLRFNDGVVDFDATYSDAFRAAVGLAASDHQHDATEILAMAGVSDTFNEDDTVQQALISLDIQKSSVNHKHSASDTTSGVFSIDRLPVTLEKSSSLGNSGSSVTLSLASASVQRVALSSNCTFTMPAAAAGATLTLMVTQGGTYTASFTGVKWPAGVSPTITATNGKVDIVRFVSDGTSWYGSINQNY